MHKLNGVNFLAFVSLPALAKRTLTILFVVSVMGCGGGETTSTGDSTPTNPQPSQSSMSAVQATSNVLPAELGGFILAPGIYTSAQSLEISNGDLVLDAQGDANAVWVFQIALDLHVASGRRVILSGGAQATNVYWQVGGSATLGEHSDLMGNLAVNGTVALLSGAQ